MGAQAVRLSNVDIDNALKNKDFEVLFQPIFDLGNGALARMETFIRWRHESLGVLPPGAFISFFETQGRMGELTRYVLAETLNAYLEWRGPNAPGFSINLALSDITDEAFVSHFMKLLRDRDFPADLVTLECPMPMVDMELNVASAHFDRLKGTGARLAIEVRGRANDLLRNIDPFPFDEIKTGGAAILRFARTVRGPGLTAISDLLDIATKANAATTAVGVEDQASLSALRSLGFTAAQGNHLAKVGTLKNFRPSRVNGVRELLGLASLETDELAALFRTKAPIPQSAAAEPPFIDDLEPPAAQTPEPFPADKADDEKVDVPAKDAAASQPTKEEPVTPPSAEAEDDARRAKAREKARALALAKRAKAREARKAAAIERAKAKAAAASGNDGTTTTSAPSPRAMQERLNKAFAGGVQEPPVNTFETKAEKLQPAPQTNNISEKRATAAASKKQDRTAAAPSSQKAGQSLIVEKKSVTPPRQKQREDLAEETSAAAPLRTSLAIGSAKAYFQPGIHIAGIGASQTPQAVSQMIGRQPAAPLSAASALSLDTAAKARTKTRPPSPTPTVKARPAPRDLFEDVPQGDLHKDLDDETRTDEARKPVRRARRKSFLKRTVIPYPKYFWPKAWKQRYLQWKAARADRQAARDD